MSENNIPKACLDTSCTCMSLYHPILVIMPVGNNELSIERVEDISANPQYPMLYNI